MGTEHSPTVRRRRLALELRRLREAARLTCEEVAEHLECSASKISRVETGRVSVSPRDVRDMLEIYGVPADHGASLVPLARAALPNGAVQVIPFAGGAHPAMGRPFIILVFPERVDTDVVYLEDLTSALYLEDVAEVDRYNVFFNHLRATALSFDDSAALITSVLKEM